MVAGILRAKQGMGLSIKHIPNVNFHSVLLFHLDILPMPSAVTLLPEFLISPVHPLQRVNFHMDGGKRFLCNFVFSPSPNLASELLGAVRS